MMFVPVGDGIVLIVFVRLRPNGLTLRYIVCLLRIRKNARRYALWVIRTVFVYYSGMTSRKLLLVVVMVFLLSLSLSAQTEITEKKFNKIKTKGIGLLKSSSYRATRKVEKFEDRSEPGRLEKTYVDEYIPPNKWRQVLVNIDDEFSREERITHGKFIYLRLNEGKWDRNETQSSSGSNSDPFRVVAKSYKYLGKTDLDGKRVDLYESRIIRDAEKLLVGIRFIETTQYWFAVDGKLLKRIVEAWMEDTSEFRRETTTINYEAKFTIEAPIK